MTKDLTNQHGYEQLKAAECAKLASFYRRLNGLDEGQSAAPVHTCRGLIDFIIAYEGLSGRLKACDPSATA